MTDFREFHWQKVAMATSKKLVVPGVVVPGVVVPGVVVPGMRGSTWHGYTKGVSVVLVAIATSN